MTDLVEGGYTRLFTIKRIPVEVHWSIVLLLVLVGGGLRFAPGAWLGAVVLMLAHELGHAAIVRVHRLRVVRIRMHGLGGVCVHSGYPNALQRAQIAWGGVLGQAVLLALTALVTAISHRPRTAFGVDLYQVFTEYNLVVAILNLLPIAPLDGHQAWRLFPLLYERAQRGVRRRRRRRRAQREMRGRGRRRR